MKRRRTKCQQILYPVVFCATRIVLQETGFLVSWRAILVGKKRCGGREPAHLVLRSSPPLRITIPDSLPIHRMGRWSSDTQLDINSRYSHIYSPRSLIPSTVAKLPPTLPRFAPVIVMFVFRLVFTTPAEGSGSWGPNGPRIRPSSELSFWQEAY